MSAIRCKKPFDTGGYVRGHSWNTEGEVNETSENADQQKFIASIFENVKSIRIADLWLTTINFRGIKRLPLYPDHTENRQCSNDRQRTLPSPESDMFDQQHQKTMHVELVRSPQIQLYLRYQNKKHKQIGLEAPKSALIFAI